MVLQHSWKQSLCADCWEKRNPERMPHVLKGDLRVEEICCDCGTKTLSGIYMRIDPETVRYPRSEEV